MKENDRAKERKKLIDGLVKRGDIVSARVIGAMYAVKRHIFVPSHMQHMAYWDTPLEIGFGQTISAPHMVGIMAENLDVQEGHKVLEIGTGSGYHAAIVAHLVGKTGHVYSVERVPELAEFARRNLKTAGLANKVTVIVGDGSKGLPQFSPYDRIYATCAAPKIPEALIGQLKPGGKLLIPIGGRFFQDLILVEKNDKIKKKNLGGCVFVPMVGNWND